MKHSMENPQPKKNDAEKEKIPTFEDEAKKIRDNIKYEEDWQEAAKNRTEYASKEVSARDIGKKREKRLPKLKALRELVRDLNEKYTFEQEKEAKANLWNQLERANKEMRKLEEELDLENSSVESERGEKDVTPDSVPPLPEKDDKEKAPEDVPTPGDTPDLNPPSPVAPTPEFPDILTDPEQSSTPESNLPLDELRDQYLKAKRLRGNVFRGGLGGLLRRKLNFGKEKMDFGGKEGALELERVRLEYQKGLARHRKEELTKFHSDLVTRLVEGTIDPLEVNSQIQSRIVGLLKEEQDNIDNRSVTGIERNMFEKMKTRWRQNSGKRLLVGGGLLGGAILTGGTAVGAGILGARTAMGSVGTYVGVESAWERYSKLLGHKGLVHKVNKEIPFTTLFEGKRRIAALPPEEIKKEAARLRMLQVEKGISVKTLGVDNAGLARWILRRDNDLAAQEVVNNMYKEDSTLSFADALSNRLSMEVNVRNELIESEVDRERIKKMLRKSTAVLAGGAVGWLIGGKLFQKPNAVEINSDSGNFHLETVPGSPLEIIPEFDHNAVEGDRLWKIIEHNLDSRNLMTGMGEGARTDVLKILNNTFDRMTPDQLRDLGFSSGDADVIRGGDVLHLGGVLGNPETVTKALLHAENISPAEVAENIRNNATIAKWYVAHSKELKEVFDAKVVDEILRGIR